MQFIKTLKRTVSIGVVSLLVVNVANFSVGSSSNTAYAAVIPSPSAIPTVVSTYVVADKSEIVTLGEQVQLKVMAHMSDGSDIELKKTTASNSTAPQLSSVHYSSTAQGVTINDATGILTYDGSAGNVPVDVKADVKYLDVKYFEGFENGNLGSFTYDPGATNTTTTSVVAKTGAGVPAHSGSYSANRSGPTTNTVRVDMGTALNGIVTAWFYNGSAGAVSPADQSRNNIYVGTQTTSGAVNVSAGLLLGEHWDGSTGSGTKFTSRLMSSSFSATSVNRGTAPAWHEFKWDLTSGTDAKMYIDGTLVGTTTAETKYQYVALLGNWLPNNSDTYYDDIKTTKLGTSLSATISIPVTTADLQGLTVSGQGSAAAITADAGTLQMTAAVNPAGAPSMVTWKVENTDGTPTNKAEISATGLLSAKGNGTVKVTATSTVKPEISNSILITISGQTIKAAGITIQAPSGATSFNTLDPVQLSASIVPADTADPSVTWAIVQGTDVATISHTGVLTPVKAGTVQIQATSNDAGGVKSNKLQLTFDVKISSLTVAGAGGATAITSRAGQLQMGATAQPGGAATNNVAWTVENGTGSASISSTGLLTAISNGIVTVKATAQDGSGVVDQCTITILGQGSHTFYVSSSSGDDANDGLSAATPWKTLNKVNGTTFIPSDKILLKAGDSWNGQLWPKGSGADGSPIVIDQYGTGNKPVINGQGNNFDTTIYNSTTTYNTGAVFLKNQEYWEINNLEVTNDDDFTTENNNAAALRAGIFFTIDANESDRVYNHIYIRNCYVHDIDGNNNAGPKENGGIIGVVKGTAPTSQPTTARFNDVRVENNTIRKVDRVAIRVAAHTNYVNDDSFGTTATYKFGNWNTNFYIGHNTMEDVGGDGIILRDTDGAVVEFNYLSKFGTRVASSNAIAGIWLAVAKNTLLQYNEVTGGPASNQDGCAFDFDEYLINTVYQYNYSHDNPMGFMLLMGTNDNDVLRYNVSQNDGIIFRHFAFDEKTTGAIYNNVFYYDGSKNQIMGSGNTVKKGYSFFNNIFYNTNTTTPTNWLNNSWSNALFSNNVFYEAGGVHPAAEPSDPNKVTADPKFVNPGGAGTGLLTANAYELKPDSPAINAGIVMSNNGGKDYKGNPLYKGFPDLGAFEFQGDTPGINHRPLISNAKYSVKADRTVTGTLSASDPDGDQLHFSIVSNGLLGTVQLIDSGTGAFVYTPNPGVTGNDSFTFKASDGSLDSGVGTVTVAIAQSNLLQNGGFEAGTTAPPPGWSSFYGTGATIISEPANVHSGSNAVKFISNNSGAEQVVSGLTPNTNYVARGWIKVMDAGNTQSFGVKNYGGTQISKSIGTLSFSEGKIIFKTGATNTSANIYSWKNTTASNDGKVAYIDDFSLSLYENPTAVSAVVNTVQDAVYSGNLAVSRYDGDALTYTITVNAAKGTAVVINPATGAFTYTPNPGATGTDTFTFMANDGIADSDAAVITVNIQTSNHAPVASDAAFNGPQNTAISGTLSAIDVDGDALSYSIVTNGTKGTAVVTNSATGSFTYTPNPGATGTDTFTFKANDGKMESNLASVTINIAANASAQIVADSITALISPVKDATKLTLPSVPAGYTVAIKTSSNTSVIALNGTIIPPSADRAVNLVLEVTRLSDNSKADTASITVTVPAKSVVQPTAAVISVSVSPTTASVAQGETQQLTATVTVVGGAAQTIRWASSDESSKVTVGENGLVTVAANAATGDYTITATSTEDSNKIGTATITVTASPKIPETPAELTAPTNLVAKAGDSQILLTWSSVTGATYYNVYQSQDHSTYHLISTPTTVTAAAYQVTGLTNGIVYYFKTSAANTVTESTYSNIVSATPVVAEGTGTPTQTGGTPTTTVPPVTPHPTPTPEPTQPTVDVFKSSIVNIVNLINAFESMVAEAKKANVKIELADIKGHWAEKTIDTFVKLHVIEGYGDGTYHPDGKITRSEFATLISRVFDISGSANHSIVLSDIGSHWAKDAIEKLANAGVLGGYDDGTFKPDQTISREEIVIILSRIVNLDRVNKDASKGKFTDISRASSYAANSIKDAAEAGIINGKKDGVFDPQGNATRAEALTVLLNALNLNPQVKILIDSLN
ncbi:S-layer homology domain-containing protein [Paenibacillus sp. N3.4]|uniref:S-layer homology domain-containing protein n=1 Tax=Paenibacillus sp. N3.4 TaxID=2603222 RepID=UPI0011C7800E|nr:S-layer homology domain-containing protein [Paenibacillus sp. N3.4]TXK83539.1 hypothetical protein FU659_13255 [Paenibacillus sp. N3.4]